MKIIASGCIKGGTGKTSTLIMVARALAKSSRRTLFIDLDTNQSATSVLRQNDWRTLDPRNIKNAAAALLSSDTDFAEHAMPSIFEHLDLMGSTTLLTRVNFAQMLLLNRIKKSSLASSYDYVLVDTPGSYHSLHVMAFQAADIIVTPVNPSELDYSPLQQLGSNISDDIGDEKLDSWKIVFNKCRPDSANQEEYFNIFRKGFFIDEDYRIGEHILDTRIPDTVKCRDSIDRQQLIGTSKDVKKFRNSICSLASELSGEKIDPLEAF